MNFRFRQLAFYQPKHACPGTAMLPLTSALEYIPPVSSYLESERMHCRQVGRYSDVSIASYHYRFQPFPNLWHGLMQTLTQLDLYFWGVNPYTEQKIHPQTNSPVYSDTLEIANESICYR